jgi:hypothetical protein
MAILETDNQLALGDQMLNYFVQIAEASAESTHYTSGDLEGLLAENVTGLQIDREGIRTVPERQLQAIGKEALAVYFKIADSRAAWQRQYKLAQELSAFVALHEGKHISVQATDDNCLSIRNLDSGRYVPKAKGIVRATMLGSNTSNPQVFGLSKRIRSAEQYTVYPLNHYNAIPRVAITIEN